MLWIGPALFGLFLCNAASGQTFTFVPEDTVLSGPLESEIVFNVTLTNVSEQVITLSLIRTVNDLPVGWESSMCFSVCFPPTTDTIATLPSYGSSPMNPQESREFSLHVFSYQTSGDGTVRVVAANVRDSLDTHVLTFHVTSTPVHVAEAPDHPARFSLGQNYPNPFNPSTRFTLDVPVEGPVSVTVYNTLGEEVAALLNREMSPGTYTLEFDGSHLPSGTYMYRLIAGPHMETRRFVLLK